MAKWKSGLCVDIMRSFLMSKGTSGGEMESGVVC